MKSCLLCFFTVLITLCSFPAVHGVFYKEDEPETVKVLLQNGEIVKIAVDDYVKRVMCAECLPDDEPETLKALAVTIRSAANYVRIYGCKHGEYDFCDSRDCCFPLAEAGECDMAVLIKVNEAVNATKDVVLTYENKPAMALYTYCSGISTSDCDEYPYIVGVPRIDNCEKHIYKITAGKTLIAEKFGGDTEENDFCIAKDKFGRCCFAVINGIGIDAYDLSETLGLPSLLFNAETDGEEVVFACYGKGNGYGLDVCFANELAREGSDWRELIAIAFPKTEITES